MTAVLLAALSGLAYGAADFSGGLASKRDDSLLVTVVVQLISLMALTLVLMVWPASHHTAGDLAWGALGGTGAGLGLAAFYRALARGPMSSVAAITAVVGAAMPVIAGIALGERPGTIALTGIVLALPAVLLISWTGTGTRMLRHIMSEGERRQYDRRTNVTRAMAAAAGLGFAVFFIALSRTSSEAGLFPLVGARIASVAALTALLGIRRGLAVPDRSAWPHLVGAGVLDCVANAFYLLAVHRGSLAWVAAIGSLYPASTLILARVVLKERVWPPQIAGLALAGGALVLVGVGR